jgi:hypothetical protein
MIPRNNILMEIQVGRTLLQRNVNVVERLGRRRKKLGAVLTCTVGLEMFFVVQRTCLSRYVAP